jgi:hypothetical protein
MPAILLRQAYQDWSCSNCTMTERTPALPPNAARFHTCPGLHMLTAPLVRTGSDCTVTAAEREDYLGGETQATGDDGRPYMAVTTTWADGHTDLAVCAGLAHGEWVT